MSRILVTGSEGWVGDRLVPELEKLGYEVVRYDKKLGMDIHDEKLLREQMGRVDAVLHLAGMRGPDCDFDGADKAAYKTILEGAEAMHEAMQDTKLKKIIYLSTGAIYGTKLYSKNYSGAEGQEGVNGIIVQDFKWPITDKSKLCSSPHPYSKYKHEVDKYFSIQGDIVGVSLRVNGIDATDPNWSTSRYNIATAIDQALKADLDSYEIINIADNTETNQVDLKKAKKILGYDGMAFHR